MIDPTACTDYGRDDYQLQEFALFCILVAGKTAAVTARSLDNLLTEAHSFARLKRFRPFEAVKQIPPGALACWLQTLGIGCHTAKARSILALIDAGLCLRTCSVQALQAVDGIGPKTARFFLLHTRPGVRAAALDTHILQYLHDSGMPHPISTQAKSYLKWEEVFLRMCERLRRGYAEMDTLVWNYYSGSVKQAARPPFLPPHTATAIHRRVSKELRWSEFPRACWTCGKEFIPAQRKSLTCSPKCWYKRFRVRMAAKQAAARQPKRCVECGKEFKSEHHNRKLCSVECKRKRNCAYTAAWRAARRLA